MASIGHIAVGMAAARLHRQGHPSRWPWLAAATVWCALSMLPDADVIGGLWGIQYADEWGHRGASHSVAVAVGCALLIGLIARLSRGPAVRITILATSVLLSHAVLDTMTNGGLGCALWWPFSATRYFAPWTPIPVAPIGLYYFSWYGLMVALTEVVLFAPVWVYGVRPGRIRHRSAVTALALGLWVGGVWLVESGSVTRERIVGALVREDTAFARGYSEEQFRRIRPGQSAAEVRALLGAPFGESWFYLDLPDTCPGAHFEDDVVVAPSWALCERVGVKPGVRRQEAERLLGAAPPLERCWRYTGSPGHRPFRLRMVCFVGERVSGVGRRWIFAGS